jgi:hypothetical protein
VKTSLGGWVVKVATTAACGRRGRRGRKGRKAVLLAKEGGGARHV